MLSTNTCKEVPSTRAVAAPGAAHRSSRDSPLLFCHCLPCVPNSIAFTPRTWCILRVLQPHQIRARIRPEYPTGGVVLERRLARDAPETCSSPCVSASPRHPARASTECTRSFTNPVCEINTSQKHLRVVRRVVRHAYRHLRLSSFREEKPRIETRSVKTKRMNTESKHQAESCVHRTQVCEARAQSRAHHRALAMAVPHDCPTLTASCCCGQPRPATDQTLSDGAYFLSSFDKG